MFLLGQVGKCMERNTASLDGLFPVFILSVWSYLMVVRESECIFFVRIEDRIFALFNGLLCDRMLNWEL